MDHDIHGKIQSLTLHQYNNHNNKHKAVEEKLAKSGDATINEYC
jgi:hypothetical protein